MAGAGRVNAFSRHRQACRGGAPASAHELGVEKPERHARPSQRPQLESADVDRLGVWLVAYVIHAIDNRSPAPMQSG